MANARPVAPASASSAASSQPRERVSDSAVQLLSCCRGRYYFIFPQIGLVSSARSSNTVPTRRSRSWQRAPPTETREEGGLAGNFDVMFARLDGWPRALSTRETG